MASPDQALMPTRIWACLPGGPASVHIRAMLWLCNSSATWLTVWLTAGVKRLASVCSGD